VTDSEATERRRLRVIVDPHAVRQLQMFALDGNFDQALALTRDKLAYGLQPVGVLCALMVPTLREIGELWHANLITHEDQARVSAVCDHVLDHVLQGPQVAADVAPQGTVIIAAPLGEAHLLGARLASVALEAAGWSVVDLGSDVPVADLVAAIRHGAEPAAVLIHAARTARLPAILAVIDVIRREHGGVMVAGTAFGAGGSWAECVGAACWVEDPHWGVLRHLPPPTPNPATVTPEQRGACSEVLRRRDDPNDEWPDATQLEDALHEAVGQLEPTRFVFDELAASVLLDESAVFTDAVMWYRGFLSSRAQPPDAIRRALLHVRSQLADVPSCDGPLAVALAGVT